jgi:hypothetical protein
VRCHRTRESVTGTLERPPDSLWRLFNNSAAVPAERPAEALEIAGREVPDLLGGGLVVIHEKKRDGAFGEPGIGWDGRAERVTGRTCGRGSRRRPVTRLSLLLSLDR